MFATEPNLAILIVALSAITAVVGLAAFLQVRKCRIEYTRLRDELNRLSENVMGTPCVTDIEFSRSPFYCSRIGFGVRPI